MNKKQREKYLRELAADPNPSLDDLLGVIGWTTDYIPEERAEADRLTAEFIRKRREENKQDAKQLSKSNDTIAKAS
jgi:hypothetical protein